MTSAPSPASARERVWRPAWPCPVPGALGALRHGRGDPTYRTDPDATVWRGIRSPEGPATLAVRRGPVAGEVSAAAWGPGAEWALAQVPDMLGASDDPTGFEPCHDVVTQAWRRFPHVRVPRSGLVTESLVPAVIEQKVTGKEAFTSWARLVRRHGEPAPGPEAGRRGLLLPPAPEVLARIPSWEWLRLHVDPHRSRTVVQVARVATSLDRLIALSAEEADRKLRSLPGVGMWTSAEVRSRAFGDADAVSFGDFHVAKDIGWALTGKPVDDDELAVLLEPYRPHRLRVQILVALAGLHRPRRGPRMTLPGHYPQPVR